MATSTVVKFPGKPEAKPRASRKTTPKAPKELGVVAQVREAFRFSNLLATSLGLVLGGFVPVATYKVAHQEIGMDAHGIAMCVLMLGGLLFSAKTVWQWAKAAFNDPWKATGFVALLEGVMTLSTQEGLSLTALILLTGINAVATGVRLSRS